MMNKTNRIAILAPANNIWVYEYIKNVALPYGFDSIFLLIGERDRYCSYYEDNGINVCVYCDEQGRFSPHRMKEIILEIGNCNYLHVQWAVCSVRAFIPIAHISDRVIITYWGSDLFDCGFFRKLINIPILHRADTIHVINANMRRVFNRIYRNKISDKVVDFDFGCSAYKYIDDVVNNYSIEECKRQFKIDEKKIVICIGYNSRKEQQHLSVINALSNLDPKYKERIMVIIPWAYGDGGRAYCERVSKALDGIGLDYEMMREFLSYDKIALLRRATDIFLYAQKTDAQSASMLEFLYAGSVVIRPSWLRFDELDRLKVVNRIYSKFEEVKGIVEKVIENDVTQERIVCDSNRRILNEFNSWPAVLPAWRRLYE